MTEHFGWQQPAASRQPSARAKCPHIGLIGAAFTIGMHAIGDEWVCVCGAVFYVVSDGHKKWFEQRKGRHL